MQFVKPAIYAAMLMLVLFAIRELIVLIGDSAVNEYKVTQQEYIAKIEKQNKELLEKKEREILTMRAEYHAQIIKQKNEIDSLANDVANGVKRLRIGASCKPMPQASTDTTRANDASAELDAVARQAYFDLRSGIVKTEAALNLCLNSLKTIAY